MSADQPMTEPIAEDSIAFRNLVVCGGTKL